MCDRYTESNKAKARPKDANLFYLAGKEGLRYRDGLNPMSIFMLAANSI